MRRSRKNRRWRRYYEQDEQDELAQRRAAVARRSHDPRVERTPRWKHVLKRVLRRVAR